MRGGGKSDVALYPDRPRETRARARARRYAGFLHPPSPRAGRGALREEARRGGDRDRARGGRGGPRPVDRGSRRPHLSSAGGARGARHRAGGRRGGAGRADRAVRPRGKSGACVRPRIDAAGPAQGEAAFRARPRRLSKDGSMEQRTTDHELSPYRVFPRAEWAERREDTPMTLTPDEVTPVRTLHDRL